MQARDEGTAHSNIDPCSNFAVRVPGLACGSPFDLVVPVSERLLEAGSATLERPGGLHTNYTKSFTYPSQAEHLGEPL